MINNACKAEDLSCCFPYFTSTKFIISSGIAQSPHLHAAACEKREVFGHSRKEVRGEIKKQFSYSERDLFYLTERTEVKK